MKTSRGATASLLGAVLLGGCAASAGQGAQVRAHTTTAAFEHHVPPQQVLGARAKRSAHKESPLASACRTGSSKSCNELGDRLVIKHAYTEARQWYAISCERVRAAMVPSATRFLELSQELTVLNDGHAEEEDESRAKQKKLAELKNDASELRARLQGCLDTGETLKVEEELKQSLKYYDAVCEFSILRKAVGESSPGFEQVTGSACARGQAARGELSGEAPFSPRLFVDLTEPRRAEAREQNVQARGSAPVQKARAAKRQKAQDEEGMVFNVADL